MSRLLRLLRSPGVRWGFLAVAVALAVVAVGRAWHDVLAAVARLPAPSLTGAAVAALAFVWCTFLAWRALLADLGSPLALRPALSVFGVSQVGKYVPGGVWNVVAAAEIGADHRVPRARSLAAMGMAVLVGVVSGGVVAAATLPFVAADALGRWSPVLWGAPVLVVLLVPPVLDRLVRLALRLARRPPLERPLSWAGLAAATSWSVAGWLLAGVHVWLLATGLGLEPTGRSLVLSVGAYALAWLVGFAVVLVPAGAGAREAVLLLLLAGRLPHAEVLVVVLLSRVLLTLVDLALAGAGLLARARASLSGRPAR